MKGKKGKRTKSQHFGNFGLWSQDFLEERYVQIRVEIMAGLGRACNC